MKINKLLTITLLLTLINYYVTGQHLNWAYCYMNKIKFEGSVKTIAKYSNGVIVGTKTELLKITKAGKVTTIFAPSETDYQNTFTIMQVLVDSEDYIYMSYNYDNCPKKFKFGGPRLGIPEIYAGKAILKLDTTGRGIWNALVGKETGIQMKILLSHNKLYVIGTIRGGLMIGDKIPLRSSFYVHPTRDILNHLLYNYDLFAAKFSLGGEAESAKLFKNGFNDGFSSADVDKEGNIYILGNCYNKMGYQFQADITKIDSGLQVVWATKLPVIPIHEVVRTKQINYSSNGKLYAWFYTVKDYSGAYSNQDSLQMKEGTNIVEVTPNTGKINKIRNLSGCLPGYVTDYGQDSLIIFTGFSDTLILNGKKITPTNRIWDNKAFNEDLILFKLNTQNFKGNYITQFIGEDTTNLKWDYPSQILYDKGTLYVTGTFSEPQLTIFGVTLKNKSPIRDPNGFVVSIQMK